VVALEVEVMSTNDDSGNTMNGTIDGEHQERRLRAFEPTVKYIDRVLLSLRRVRRRWRVMSSAL
jgi:hypothetical protein